MKTRIRDHIPVQIIYGCGNLLLTATSPYENLWFRGPTLADQGGDGFAAPGEARVPPRPAAISGKISRWRHPAVLNGMLDLGQGLVEAKANDQDFAIDPDDYGTKDEDQAPLPEILSHPQGKVDRT
jgi:hypothetical protein